MTDTWHSVKWSEPVQVLSVLKKKDLSEAEGHTVEGYYRMLVEAKRYFDAIDYMSQALPRYHAVVWAARTLNDLAGDGPRPQALKSALLWVQDPSESRRRAAYDAAEAADDCSAEEMLALAVFFSGGSIAPDGQPPLAPPRQVAGTFSAAAIKIGVTESKDAGANFDMALKHAEALAMQRSEGGAQ